MSDITEERFPDSAPGEDEDRTYGASEFADNPEPRCPVLIIANCSGSMAGPPMACDESGSRHAVPGHRGGRGRAQPLWKWPSCRSATKPGWSTTSARFRSTATRPWWPGASPICTWRSSRAATSWMTARSSIGGTESLTTNPSWCLQRRAALQSRSEMQRVNDRLVEMENHRRLTIFKVAVTAEAVRAMQRALPNPVSTDA